MKRRRALQSNSPLLGRSCLLCGLAFAEGDFTVIIKSGGREDTIHWSHVTTEETYRAKVCHCTPETICLSCEHIILCRICPMLMRARERIVSAALQEGVERIQAEYEERKRALYHHLTERQKDAPQTD